jgi:hypothetical protein
MGNPTQSQDVEHRGPKVNPLDSRQRQSRGSREKAARDPLDRKADTGPEQPADGNSQLSQHRSTTPSRP